MQPCSREMQGMPSSLNGLSSSNSSANSAQLVLQELQNGNHHQIHDDFFDQMLSTLPSWPDLGNPNIVNSDGSKPTSSDGLHYVPYDESSLLASRLRQHQISGGTMNHNQQQQMLLSSTRATDSGLLPLPLTLGSGLVDRSTEDVDASFKQPNSMGGEGLYNGFARSIQTANQQHFHHPQGGSMAPQNFGGQPPATAAGATGGGGATAPPRQRVRARRGQATDPHSIAERLRRERIAERMKALQELVPNANKTDKASMLDEIIDYVKFLQLQVKVLSMSRLGGAAAVAPLVADISSEGGRGGNNSSGAPPASDSLTVTEHQVAKLMEEDMGSAMQYLQGKGLCLMPISLASAISTATCHPRGNPTAGGGSLMNTGLLPNSGSDAPPSPSLSVLTVQSAIASGSAAEIKDAASVSKP